MQSLCTDGGAFYSSHAEEGRTIDRNKNDVLKIKVHQSQYRPITDLDGSRMSRFPDCKTVGTRRSLYPRKYSWHTFLLQLELTSVSQFGRNNEGNEKFQWHQRKSERKYMLVLSILINIDNNYEDNISLASPSHLRTRKHTKARKHMKADIRTTII